MITVHEFLQGVAAEVERAQAKHPLINSAHEGYAVLLEEMDELWAEIKQQQHDPVAMRRELVQIAAMCARFDADVLQGGA